MHDENKNIPKAATVILVYEASHNILIYLIKRPSRSSFMANAHVFPGGRLDPEDFENSQNFIKNNKIKNLGLNLWPYKFAAIRECFEEANIKLKNISSLKSFSHWITPEIEPKRFDTRFFMTRVTQEQFDKAQHCQHEATEGIWISPEEALNKFKQDKIFLAPPTYLSLKSISESKNYESCLKQIKFPNSPIMPEFKQVQKNNQDSRLLVLPGDKLFSNQKAQQVYSKTRFKLIDGRFR